MSSLFGDCTNLTEQQILEATLKASLVDSDGDGDGDGSDEPKGVGGTAPDERADSADRPGMNRGLKNNGNTCFLNAVLQCLNHTGPLRDHIVSKLTGGGEVTRNLAFLLSEMNRQSQGITDPATFMSTLKEHLKKHKMDGLFDGNQQDSHELEVNLLAALEDEEPTGQVGGIADLLIGQTVSTIKCSECKNKRTVSDPSMHICVQIPKKSGCVTLEDCLQDFCKSEELKGGNKVECPNCQKKTEARKQIKVVCKQTVIIQLKRFEFRQNGSAHKITTPVQFPLRGLELGEGVYDCVAVTNHDGVRLDRGHYTATGKGSGGNWSNFDDVTVENNNEYSNANEERVTSQKAYSLYYIRRGSDGYGVPPGREAHPNWCPGVGRIFLRATDEEAGAGRVRSRAVTVPPSSDWYGVPPGREVHPNWWPGAGRIFLSIPEAEKIDTDAPANPAGDEYSEGSRLSFEGAEDDFEPGDGPDEDEDDGMSTPRGRGLKRQARSDEYADRVDVGDGGSKGPRDGESSSSDGDEDSSTESSDDSDYGSSEEDDGDFKEGHYESEENRDKLVDVMIDTGIATMEPREKKKPVSAKQRRRHVKKLRRQRKQTRMNRKQNRFNERHSGGRGTTRYSIDVKTDEDGAFDTDGGVWKRVWEGHGMSDTSSMLGICETKLYYMAQGDEKLLPRKTKGPGNEIMNKFIKVTALETGVPQEDRDIDSLHKPTTKDKRLLSEAKEAMSSLVCPEYKLVATDLNGCFLGKYLGFRQFKTGTSVLVTHGQLDPYETFETGHAITEKKCAWTSVGRRCVYTRNSKLGQGYVELWREDIHGKWSDIKVGDRNPAHGSIPEETIKAWREMTRSKSGRQSEGVVYALDNSRKVIEYKDSWRGFKPFVRGWCKISLEKLQRAGRIGLTIDERTYYAFVRLTLLLVAVASVALAVENSWDLVNSRYPLSNACGQLGQSYQDYSCSPGEEHMQCQVDPTLQITATTHASWYGAPAPLFCGPKSTYPFTGVWDHSYECNKAWANPPEYCDVYEGQKAGRFKNDSPYANRNGRTDVEGCCYWGRGVIQTTGVCNFGKLNYYLGKRAADEGRPSRYGEIDFCKTPNKICDSEDYKELKWIAGLFYWVESLQSYDIGGWDYTTELHKFVDGGLSGSAFIDAVSGIVNRGCHNPPCATGDVDGKSERAQNFIKVLAAFGLA
ncbi:hypothetical protein THAOC_25123 [Thalassiosira oceanica]|uniref:USP domain-containing protein n=1 Tax=Thalassiosira oceanica TaxID=159749 RepID=K0RN55_THAOC|nr:hypothetical protein THAOC_25123 [Thalassiosira oceanica]|eukprot:EJK55173.1 hypothetical protein THAOC_25123 [Thalassiosira oceanica]